MNESKLQSEIVRYLKSKGAIVLKNDANYRTGIPDLSFWHSELCGMIEVKALPSSPYRPLQQITIHKLQDMGVFCEVIHSENWGKWKTKFDLWLS